MLWYPLQCSITSLVLDDQSKLQSINLWYCNILRDEGDVLLSTVTFAELWPVCEGVSKSFRIGRLKRELQMVQLSATRCSCIYLLYVSLVSFAAIALCVASQQVFVVVYFVIDSVRKLLDTPSYIITKHLHKDYKLQFLKYETWHFNSIIFSLIITFPQCKNSQRPFKSER
jgi:hypothetical protein